MTDIYVLETDSFKAYHNQALEKYLLEDVKDDTVILYLWQNEKTIVIGRNQDAYAECDIARLEKENGYLARRITGGGAVYHDRGNLNFTFVCPKDLYDPDEQDEIILVALRSLGIESEKNGRNDLLVNGRKFSGHAYYKGKKGCIHHGTLMVDVKEEDLSRFLNVSLKKLENKNVSSVRSRIINLKQVKDDLTVDMLKKALIKAFEEHYHGISRPYDIEDKARIQKLEKQFDDPSWRYGDKKDYRFTNEKKTAEALIKIAFDLEDDKIRDLVIYTDSLDPEAVQGVKKKLIGKKISEINDTDEETRQIAGMIREVCDEI